MLVRPSSRIRRAYAEPVDAVRATRYVTPLREGGSLPGLMEADDLGMYVVKFHGAGQGPRALVAEVICAELAEASGLPVPRWVPVVVPEAIAPAEPDEEVQYLLRASPGWNLGVDFLPGALDVGPVPGVSSELAGRILWFDALINNVDRTWRNPNMLIWHRSVHLIDHGAALTFHHSWTPGEQQQVRRFAERRYDVADHALLGCAPDVAGATEAFAQIDWPEAVAAAVDAVPEPWLAPDAQVWGSVAAVRGAYRDFLGSRLALRGTWLPALIEGVGAAVRRLEGGLPVYREVTTEPPDWLPELRVGRPGT